MLISLTVVFPGARAAVLARVWASGAEGELWARRGRRGCPAQARPVLLFSDAAQSSSGDRVRPSGLVHL